MDGLDDLGDLFQPWWVYDSMTCSSGRSLFPAHILELDVLKGGWVCTEWCIHLKPMSANVFSFCSRTVVYNLWKAFTCSLTNCPGRENLEDWMETGNTVMQKGNFQHSPAPLPSFYLLQEQGLWNACSALASLCGIFRSSWKHCLLAAGNRQWGLNAGNCCEKEGSANWAQRVSGWKEKKAGVNQRKQESRIRMSLCLTACFQHSWCLKWCGISALGVWQQDVLWGDMKSPRFSSHFGESQLCLSSWVLHHATRSSWMILIWPKSPRKCFSRKQSRLDKIKLVWMAWLAHLLPFSLRCCHSPFLHGLAWAAQAVRAGWVIITSPLGNIFLFQNLVLLLILNGKWSFGTWLQKLGWEPHDARHSSTVELAALWQPLFKAFPQLASQEVKGNPNSQGAGGPGPKHLWFLSFLSSGLWGAGGVHCPNQRGKAIKKPGSAFLHLESFHHS